jgi:hypothetical protein
MNFFKPFFFGAYHFASIFFAGSGTVIEPPTEVPTSGSVGGGLGFGGGTLIPKTRRKRWIFCDYDGFNYGTAELTARSEISLVNNGLSSFNFSPTFSSTLSIEPVNQSLKCEISLHAFIPPSMREQKKAILISSLLLNGHGIKITEQRSIVSAGNKKQPTQSAQVIAALAMSLLLRGKNEHRTQPAMLRRTPWPLGN